MDTVALMGARFLEVLFLVGMAGSAIVVAISFVEDLFVLFRSDEHPDARHTPQN